LKGSGTGLASAKCGRIDRRQYTWGWLQ